MSNNNSPSGDRGMNVVVTGASRGMGKAIAEIFAANGHSLFITSRSEVKLYKTMEEMQNKYPSVTIKANPFNLAKKEEAVLCGSWILKHAVPDVLVNNAGNFLPGSVNNEEDGFLEEMIETNLYSSYHLTRTVLPKMMERKSGYIFNNCSIASLKAYKNGGAYSISKYAQYGFSKNLREEMKPYNIKVIAILAGAAMTDSWEGFDNSSGRIMEPGDIAKLVYTCTQLSPQACVEEIVIRPQLGDL